MGPEVSFSGKYRPYAVDIKASAYDAIDYLGLNAALYEWAESYDSKVR